MRIVDLYYLIGGKEGSWLQRKWSEYCNKRIYNRKKKYLHDNGLLVLNKFHEACKCCHISGWLEFGTLLGAYREHSFIAHDFDLDVGMYAEDYTEDFDKSMHQLGFKKMHSFYLLNQENNTRTLSEITYSYDGFAIDIFLSQRKENSRTVYVFIANGTDKPAVNQYDLNLALPTEEIFINGHQFDSPNNPAKLLCTIYGPNFMVPDPTWRTASDENRLVRRLDYNIYCGFCKMEDNNDKVN